MRGVGSGNCRELLFLGRKEELGEWRWGGIIRIYGCGGKEGNKREKLKK